MRVVTAIIVFLLCGELHDLPRENKDEGAARFIGNRGECFLLEVNLHHFFLLFSEFWFQRRIEDVTQNRPKRADVSLEISSGAERAFSGSAPDRAAGE